MWQSLKQWLRDTRDRLAVSIRRGRSRLDAIFQSVAVLVALGVIIIAVLVGLTIHWPITPLVVLGTLISAAVFAAGLVFGFICLLLIAPLALKDELKNDPNLPKKLALFTEVEPGRAKIKMRGGRAVGVIRGRQEEDKDKLEWSHNLLWALYQRYVYRIAGLFVIGVPYFQTIYTYALPHYRVSEEGGKKKYVKVHPNEEGYRSDHLRNELSTWYFMFSGAEVDTIPMTVQGSLQIRIAEGRECDAVFKSDSWNILLEQATTSVFRGIMRSKISLDQIIGKVDRDIWKDSPQTETYETVRKLAWEALKSYTIQTTEGEKTLEELVGLIIARVDIIDFAPDLEGEELAKLSAPAFSRQSSRARAIAGQGEAEYQEKVLTSVDKFKDLSKDGIWADALVKASKEGSLDALAAGLLKNVVQKKG